MNKSLRNILVVAGLVSTLTACSTGPAKVVDPRQPSLLAEFPDSKVLPIGALQRQNMAHRAFEDYPDSALRNFPEEAPKVGCVMLEVLVGTDGRVRRTAVAESYPRSIFDSVSSRDARMDRYSPQKTEVITYQFYQFDLDSKKDTGLIITHRSMGATEVLLELNFKKRYENYVRNTTGWSEQAPSFIRMPRQCKTLYNRYAVFSEPKDPAAAQ